MTLREGEKMFKEITIAALAAGLLLRIPWFAACTAWTRATIWLGLTMCLLFFCLFCEEQYEKWREYKERVGKLQELVKRLAKGKGGTGDAPERSDIQ